MSNRIEVKVPDLGGAPKADVIGINVTVGDRVEVDDALVTLEGDKASMDIPSPHAGVVKEIKLAMGDKVSEGSLILILESDVSDEQGVENAPVVKEGGEKSLPNPPLEKEETHSVEIAKSAKDSESNAFEENGIYAGPLVRQVAREFGVDLSKIQGTARKGRITKEDVQAFVKSKLSQASNSGSGFSLPASPVIDFSKWGDIETMPLNKIKRLTAENMTRNWLTVPHVTQFDSADITDLEAFRNKHKAKAEKEGYKLTPLAFVVKAVAAALAKFPTFNASLDATGENLILKKYCHIGVAVDTPNGLVVPVLQDADKKSVSELAKGMADLSVKARDKALLPKDMMGSSFTISSLGGIGGTAFTPIVNVPNVAILGVSKAKIEPVYIDGQFVPRLMLPLSLSYDHRVVDGADAARFIVYLSACLEDLKLLLI
jgi:pyruvate dehydrogenase E2 component (dihydrolipoamide acetyltransferase)